MKLSEKQIKEIIEEAVEQVENGEDEITAADNAMGILGVTEDHPQFEEIANRISESL